MNDKYMEAEVMDDKLMIKSALESLGYKPQVDSDGDMYLRYQMKAFYFTEEDTEYGKFVTVILPQLYEFDDSVAIKILAACNKLNRDLRLAKLFVNQTFDGVSVTCEFFYEDECALKQNLCRSIAALGMIRTAFLKVLGELSD